MRSQATVRREKSTTFASADGCAEVCVGVGGTLFDEDNAGFRLIKPVRPGAGHRATVSSMYSAPGLITLIVAALVGTIIGNLVQLRFFMNNPVMKSPFVRYGSLVVAVLIMINIVPDPQAQMTTEQLLTYGLWWVLIAFLVSFVRPPAPLAPRKTAADDQATTIDVEATDPSPDEEEAARR